MVEVYGLGFFEAYGLGGLWAYERAHAFDADPEVKEMIAEVVDSTIDPLLKDYSPEKVEALRSLAIDPDAIGATGLGWERLDQLLMEHLLGTR